MSNPYWGADFGRFFSILGKRMLSMLRGDELKIASDEMQILVLLGIAVACALVGTFLVVRKMAMVANSLSHTILLGVVLAVLMRSGILDSTTLIISACLTALLTVGLSSLLTRSPFVREDAGIGLSFTTLFALGLIALMLFSKNNHIGVEVVMGNLDAAHPDDIFFSWMIALVDGFAILILYPWLKTYSFDPIFSRSLRLPCLCLNFLFVLMVSLTCVAAFRFVGVLIVLSFLIGPALCGRIICRRMGSMLWLSIGSGAMIALLSVASARHMLSVYHLPLSTAGIASLLNILFVLFALASTARRMVPSLTK
jgi:manganese/zinc/iron transport system permease protein